MRFLHRTWAVVDLDALVHNAQVLKALIPQDCRFMSVVKADGYGHGDGMVAKTLEPISDFFGVSNLEEGISLRRQGIELPILILGASPPEEVDRVAEYRITPAVYSLEHARSLDRACAERGVKLGVHIKVDTGMGRLGFCVTQTEWERARAEITVVSQLEHLSIEGIFTHFAVADEADEDSVEYTHIQLEALDKLCEALRESQVFTGLVHCCNSAAVVNYPTAHRDMVRPGTALYGLIPGELFGPLVDLRPVMELYTTVTMVKTVAPGRSLSYGRTYKSEREMRVATLAIGYADGYPRGLGNRARMLVRGQFAPVVGRVCMDQLLLDVTHIPGVQAGDVVTIVGRDGDRHLTFEEMAALCDTAAIELSCGLSRRVPRLYRQGEEMVALGKAVTEWVQESQDTGKSVQT